MGHADHEISEAFSKFDHDRNQILDEEEQKRMKSALEDKRVRARLQERTYTRQWRSSTCVFMMRFVFCVQDALSAEINNLGGNYKNDSPVSGNEQRNDWSQAFVDREQFLRWGKFS